MTSDPYVDGFLYLPDFLSAAENSLLVERLLAVPTKPEGSFDRRGEFAFRFPVYDGFEVRTRREAAAGFPIWVGGAVQGPLIPEFLDDLRQHVEEALLGQPLPGSVRAPLSSVYVDRYEPGGSFAVHTDRHCYGEMVVGVSAGDGKGVLHFEHEGSTGRNHRIEPRSLYAFYGAIRYEPWRHGFRNTTGTRFAITFRSSITPK